MNLLCKFILFLFCEIVLWICFVNLFSWVCAFVNLFQEFVDSLSLFCSFVLGVWFRNVNCEFQFAICL